MSEQNITPKARTGFNKFLLIYFISSIVIIAVLSVGFTFKAKEFRDHGPLGFILGKVVKELELTSQQKTEIDKIRDEIKAKMDENRKQREEHMKGFGKMFMQDKMDKDEMLKHAKEQDAKRDEMSSFMIDELIKVHDILTPEQRVKAVEKMKEMKGKHRMHEDDGSIKDFKN